MRRGPARDKAQERSLPRRGAARSTRAPLALAATHKAPAAAMPWPQRRPWHRSHPLIPVGFPPGWQGSPRTVRTGCPFLPTQNLGPRLPLSPSSFVRTSLHHRAGGGTALSAISLTKPCCPGRIRGRSWHGWRRRELLGKAGKPRMTPSGSADAIPELIAMATEPGPQHVGFFFFQRDLSSSRVIPARRFSRGFALPASAPRATEVASVLRARSVRPWGTRRVAKSPRQVENIPASLPGKEGLLDPVHVREQGETKEIKIKSTFQGCFPQKTLMGWGSRRALNEAEGLGGRRSNSIRMARQQRSLSAPRNPALAGWPHHRSGTHHKIAMSNTQLKSRNSKASALLPSESVAVINARDDLRKESGCMPLPRNRGLLRASSERLGQDWGCCVALAAPKGARWCFWPAAAAGTPGDRCWGRRAQVDGADKELVPLLPLAGAAAAPPQDRASGGAVDSPPPQYFNRDQMAFFKAR